jgi:asparagine synthase (glutamine-hydrolysing)
MCGISGVVSNKVSHSYEWVSESLAIMRHRGPDSNGILTSEDGSVTFGHTRLAIIDLSNSANQPMSDLDKKIHIVFNGEIYNYQLLRKELINLGASFITQSDTEVILYAYKFWGLNFVNRLSGMFAIAIYDSILKNLVLVRDRTGEKPLYYWNYKGSLLFSSESKTFFSHKDFNRKIDVDSFNCFLSLGFVPNGSSIFTEIKKLLPGNILVYNKDKNEINISQYWNVSRLIKKRKSIDSGIIINELNKILSHAVEKQLVSDVPLGVLLSGGVDSSIITALASKIRKIQTYHVRFPDSKNQEDFYSANMISNFYNTDHHVLNANETSFDILPLLASQLDDPIMDSSIIPMFLISKMVASNCKVVLGGDGGDELFGGYKHYQRLLKVNNYSRYIPITLRNFIVEKAQTFFPLGYKGKNWFKAFGTDFNISLPLIANYFDFNDRSKLLNDNSLLSTYPETYWQNQYDREMDMLNNALNIDFHNYLVEDILVKSDRMSMLNSLEVRSPFLDHDLVEFVYTNLPQNLKVSNDRRKIILQNFAAKLLPKEFNANRKQGFSIPLSEWMKSSKWKSFFEEVLLDGGQKTFSHKAISHLINYKNGFINYEAVFGLVVFELWRKNSKAVF